MHSNEPKKSIPKVLKAKRRSIKRSKFQTSSSNTSSATKKKKKARRKRRVSAQQKKLADAAPPTKVPAAPPTNLNVAAVALTLNRYEKRQQQRQQQKQKRKQEKAREQQRVLLATTRLASIQGGDEELNSNTSVQLVVKSRDRYGLPFSVGAITREILEEICPR